jgi:hypothetical protein
MAKLKDCNEHRVLPDGCIDIVFINDEPPIVVGPWTVSFVARLAPGSSITRGPAAPWSRVLPSRHSRMRIAQSVNSDCGSQGSRAQHSV